jgi:chorismate dehydratase
MATTQAYRFCVLPYANALPLVHFIAEVYPAAELLYRTPQLALGTLSEGMADAALVPVADYFRRPDLVMIPGLGICADGAVTSVLLQCQRPLSEVTVIRLDPESRTSNTLIQVLMRDRFRTRRRIAYSRTAGDADARVCIGDRALCAATTAETYDLADEWKKMTGLPFVFAVWAVRRSCPHVEEISGILRRAKERGCHCLIELAELCAQRLGLPGDRCYEYLAERLHYDVGPAECDGMSLFRGLAASLLQPEADHSRGQNASTRGWS